MRHPAGLDFDTDLKPLTAYQQYGQERPLPNWEQVDAMRVLNDIAARGHMMHAYWGYVSVPGLHSQWTQFFFMHGVGQGLGLDGTGYTITYSTTLDREANKMCDTPIVGHFAICKHEKVAHADANHERGWHPGHCKHCGLDMSVDSGD